MKSIAVALVLVEGSIETFSVPLPPAVGEAADTLMEVHTTITPGVQFVLNRKARCGRRIAGLSRPVREFRASREERDGGRVHPSRRDALGEVETDFGESHPDSVGSLSSFR